MDEEEIIRMARKEGVDNSWDINWFDPYYACFAKLVAAAEREAVLQAIEAVYMLEEDRNPMFSDGYKYALDQIETLIKARGQR
jgi:hypothetical protein